MGSARRGRLCILPPVASWRAELQGLPLDLERGRVVVEGHGRRLYPQEQAVLAVLLLREAGTHDALQTALWGCWLEPPESASSAVRVIIAGLRRKLEGSGAVVCTLYNRGYCLRVAANDNRPDEGKAA